MFEVPFRSGCVLAAVLLVVLGMACDRHAAPAAYGMEVGAGEATPLAAVLPPAATHEGEEVIVEGEIAEVCPTAGCWCVLADGDLRLHVTFTTFVLPRAAEGRRCRVAGRLAVQEGRPTLLATGLALLAD